MNIPKLGPTLRPWPLFAALTLLLSACSLQATETSDTVALIAGKAITQAELEDSLATDLQALDTQRHQLLEAGLERLIEERLIKAEADKRQMSVEELVAAELESQTSITDAEVDAWYEENSERVRQPKEAIADRIREHLAQQGQLTRRQDFVATLREKYPVEIKLEPLRLELTADSAPAKGSAKATVTLVEFSDFQCPACRSITPAIEQIHQKYGDRVRIAFRQFPLRSIHPQAQKAAEAALCAEEQGQFWEMHDTLFAHQSELQVDQLKSHAATLGLDAEKFDRCLDGDQMKAAVQADLDAGRQVGVGGTPTLFVNGRPLSLSQASPVVDQISTLIDDELSRAKGKTTGTR